MVENNLNIILFILYLIKNGIFKIINDEKKNYIINQLICDNIIYNKLKGLIFDTEFNNDNTHLIKNKLFEFIKKTTLLHILWFCPEELEITNYDNFIYLVEELNKIFSNSKSKYNIELDDDNLTQTLLRIISDYKYLLSRDEFLIKFDELIKSSCNFYELYGQTDFCHNIRHINIYKTEIDSLIKYLFIFRKEYLKISNPDFHVTAHYANFLFHSVYHMHTYHNKHGKIIENFDNYFDISVGRFLLWDKQIKYTNYINADIDIFFDIPYDKLDEYLKSLGRYLILN